MQLSILLLLRYWLYNAAYVRIRIVARLILTPVRCLVRYFGGHVKVREVRAVEIPHQTHQTLTLT